MSDPYLPFINRQLAQQDVERVFAAHCDLIHDMVNYGSALVRRCFDQSTKQIKDATILLHLGLHLIAMIDAVEELIRVGAARALPVVARSALEASFAIDWLLADRGGERWKAYWVANRRKARTWALRGIAGSPEEKAFKESEKKQGLEVAVDPEAIKDFPSFVEAINRSLSSEEFATVNARYDANRRKDGTDAPWHKIAGAESVFAIARDIGREHEYRVFYALGSDVVHASSYHGSVTFTSEGLSVAPIRSPFGITEIVHQVTNLAVAAFRKLLEAYRPGEVENFLRKYMTEWRSLFLNVPSIRRSDVEKSTDPR